MMEPPRAFEGTAYDLVCDDALLLHEFAHRTANEVAAASAALHLANGAKPVVSARLLQGAAARLEAFGELNRLLARPVRRRVDVAADLVAVCRTIGTHGAAAGSEVALRIPETWIDGVTARRLVLVAAELVTNAVRHALEGRAGRLDVSLDVVAEDLVLEVRDDGAGVRPGSRSSGTGLGRGIVSQLVERGRGTVSMESGPTGTTVRVTLPLTSGRIDADIPF